MAKRTVKRTAERPVNGSVKKEEAPEVPVCEGPAEINNQNFFTNNANTPNSYESQINELKRQLKEEKNKNQILINEITNLKKINNDMIQKYETKIKSLNYEIENQRYKQDDKAGYSFILKPGEKIMTINFSSIGNQAVCNYSLPCKKTDLFVRLEEKLYDDFPQFKKYETYFEVQSKRIKRFQTLEENNIKNNDVINMFIIDN